MDHLHQQILSRFAALSRQNPGRQTLIAAEREGLLEDLGGVSAGRLVGAELSDLTELIEAQDVLVMRGSAVHGDPNWQLDPAECSMIAPYDSCVPLIFLNNRAVGKERLLLRACTVLLWGKTTSLRSSGSRRPST